MKKVISNLLMALVLIFSLLAFNKNVFASTEEDFTYDDYLQGISEGWIGEDVSYETLLELREESRLIEEELIKSEDFYEVKTLDRLCLGDIVITNGTSSAGLFGHVAIATYENAMLHIAGKGRKPETVTIEEFKNNYGKKGWIRVYRPKDSNAGVKAARWARDIYENSDAKYMITMNLKSTSVTYCSKLVWQGYYFGAGKDSVYNKNTIRIVFPYSLGKKEIKDVELKGEL